MAARRRKLAPPLAIRPGTKLGRLRVGRLLHAGGMAQIFAVEGRQPRVVKVPRLGPDHPPASLVAFENECQVLARLRGPHVPAFVAAGDPVQQPCLVMERIDGDVLAQAAARAPLAVEEIRDLGARLALALHALHRQNVIHLDLNPANVRSRADGTLVLIDFGLAHHASLPDLHDAAFGEVEGTTAYIAPEQLHHVRHDSRSDIYALGAILYQLSTGQYPFGRPNLLSLKQRLVAPPLPPRVHRPDLPPWLQEIILRCLETRPDDRYATAKRVAHLLAHPESVPDTRRSHRRTAPGFLARARALARSVFQKFDDGEAPRPQQRLRTSPHVLVALDPEEKNSALLAAMRHQVFQMAAADPKSYFTLLAVVSPALQAAARGKATPDLRHQAWLRHWAQALRLAEARLVYLVLPGKVAPTLLGYARRHQVDHLVVGAHGASVWRQHLGSVSAAVAAQATCPVTVVRAAPEA